MKNNGAPGAVTKIYEDNDLRMITFFWARGLGIYTHSWKPVIFYPHIPPSDTSLESRAIHDIWRDFNGIYWITTSRGLVRFDFKKKQFKSFMPPDGNDEVKEDQKTQHEITPYDHSSFYVRSHYKGIYRFDFKKEEFTEHLVNDEKAV